MKDEGSKRSPGRDAGILILLFVVLGIIWFVRGGPEKLSRTPPKPFLSTTGFSLGESSINYSQPGSTLGSSNVYYPPPIPVNSLYEQLGIDEDYNEGQAELEVSEYQGKITLGSGRAKWSDPDGEYIEIRASLSNVSGINIAGWTVEGKIGLNLKIPKAVRLYRSNQVNREENIFLKPGEKIILATGRSPIGDSFLVNKCSGYFSQHQAFSPSLYSQCPYPKDEDWPVSLSDDCLDYIETLPRCKANFSHPLYTENNCIESINKTLNYNSCIDLHGGDDDFYRGEWRVYLGREEEMWKNRRENIVLRDDKGKIVDEINYK